MTEATDDERKQIHLLASEPESVNLSRQAQSDLLSYGLTKADVCDEIVTWIDAGERVKVTVLHSYKGLVGQKAFELKPRIEGRIYYVKVMIQISSDTEELLLIISTHLNH
jgi:hypothetical protein